MSFGMSIKASTNLEGDTFIKGYKLPPLPNPSSYLAEVWGLIAILKLIPPQTHGTHIIDNQALFNNVTRLRKYHLPIRKRSTIDNRREMLLLSQLLAEHPNIEVVRIDSHMENQLTEDLNLRSQRLILAEADQAATEASDTYSKAAHPMEGELEFTFHNSKERINSKIRKEIEKQLTDLAIIEWRKLPREGRIVSHKEDIWEGQYENIKPNMYQFSHKLWLERLPTAHRLNQRDGNVDPNCARCGLLEDQKHIFTQCSEYAEERANMIRKIETIINQARSDLKTGYNSDYQWEERKNYFRHKGIPYATVPMWTEEKKDS
jgi:hypothetical protein